MAEPGSSTPAGRRRRRDATRAAVDDEQLFARLRAADDRHARNVLVVRYRWLTVRTSARYTGKGVADEDLRQVASVALIRAIERFDPGRGVPFEGYASAVIDGQLKEHFRDRTWSVKVPRSLRTLSVSVRTVQDELAQTLGRSPSLDEVASALGTDTDRVIEALAAGASIRAAPLDAGGGGQAPAGEPAAPDHELGVVESRRDIVAAMAALPERERQIIAMRFFDELTQSEIGERLGLSQMHVSRLLRRALLVLREELAEPRA